MPYEQFTADFLCKTPTGQYIQKDAEHHTNLPDTKIIYDMPRSVLEKYQSMRKNQRKRKSGQEIDQILGQLILYSVGVGAQRCGGPNNQHEALY